MQRDIGYCNNDIKFKLCNTCYRNINLHTNKNKYIWFLKPYFHNRSCINYLNFKNYLGKYKKGL